MNSADFHSKYALIQDNNTQSFNLLLTLMHYATPRANIHEESLLKYTFLAVFSLRIDPHKEKEFAAYLGQYTKTRVNNFNDLPS